MKSFRKIKVPQLKTTSLVIVDATEVMIYSCNYHNATATTTILHLLSSSLFNIAEKFIRMTFKRFSRFFLNETISKLTFVTLKKIFIYFFARIRSELIIVIIKVQKYISRDIKNEMK